MASFQEELKLARQKARNRHQKHQSQNSIDLNVNYKIKDETKDDDKNNDKINDLFLKKYWKKEQIHDQIKCNHSLNGKQRCINCVSRQLLTINKHELSLKNGLYHYIFSTKNENIQDLVKISRCSDPNLMQHFQPKSSLQYGEILFYSFSHILFKIQTLSPSSSFNYKNSIFIDFGSGIAKTLFIASLLYPFKQCIGIEIIHKIHLKALNYKQKIPNKYNNLFLCKPNNLNIIHGNIFDETLLNQSCFSKHNQLNNSNYIIFVASTAFNDNLMSRLSKTLIKIFQTKDIKHQKQNGNDDQKTNQTDSDSVNQHRIWIITLSHPLPNKEFFSVKHHELFRMSWGNCDVYFQLYQPSQSK